MEQPCLLCDKSFEECKCYPQLLDVQSGIVNFTVNNSVPELASEVTSFHDQNPAYTYAVDSEPDSTFAQADMGDLSLGNFLSRPVLIQSFAWSTDQPNLYQRFNPWQDFFEEPRIANRIAHYAFMRAKLKVRILINGNSFYYGRLIASYVPLHDFDPLSQDRANISQDVVQASQRPHVYLDPTFSSGGELHLPFFYPENAVNVNESEYDRLGEMVFHTINPLKHANGATGTVTVNVFAWAEDVQLFGPTAGTSSALDPQSGEDEYGTGPISKPASIVSRVAGKLTSIPPIAPYARATEIGAGALAKVASLLGYCRPNDISAIQTFRPQWGGNMANTNVDDTAIKLAVDCKQELTVDPRTVGLSGQDELSLKSIATRESYLTTFDWPVSAQRDQKLYDILVTPGVHDTYDNNGVTEYHFPACAFVMQPFTYWKGTMKYRFQIVSSNFHRGRLRIVYEPDFPNASLDYTTNYNRIIDIAKDKDFTIDIGWAMNRPYARSIGVTTGTTGHGTSISLSTVDYRANGKISVYVVNDLTVPNSVVDNDIQVNVFVSAGEDISFAQPDDDPQRFALNPPPLEAQSGEVEQVDELTPEPSAPVQSQIESTIAAPCSETDPTNHVFFGEEIRSFRQLLKRYNYYMTEAPPDQASGLYWWTLTMPAFPLMRGTPLSGAAQSGGTNITNNTLLNYLSPAFNGWRGGIRHKIYMTNTDTSGLQEGHPDTNAPFQVSRHARLGTGSVYSNDFSTVDLSSNVGARISQQGVLDNTLSGATANPLDKNSVADVEIPFYNFWRFLPTKIDSNSAQGKLARIGAPALKVISRSTAGESSLCLYDYIAVGEDFQMFFYTGPPVMYRRDTV